MKRLFGILLSLFLCADCFALASLSPFAEKTIDDFMNERMLLSLCKTDEEALRQIDAFENSTRADINAKCTEEEKLILSNFFLLERFNYMRDDAANTSALQNAFSRQNDLIQSWLSSNPDEKPNKWLYVTAGDVISVCMSFDPIRMALKYGLTVKKYYEKALEQDASFSYAQTNLAQWYYYAPAISGGSKKKARALFDDALKSARNDAERYFALIFLSQAAFDEKNYSKCEALLYEADSYAPGGRFVDSLRKLNASGHSMFSSNSKKAGQ